jgi:hypothetical protein
MGIEYRGLWYSNPNKNGAGMTRTPEEMAQEIDRIEVMPEYTDDKGLAAIAEVIRRDRREQAALVLPLVKRALAELSLSCTTGEAAQHWLGEAEKCVAPGKGELSEA